MAFNSAFVRPSPAEGPNLKSISSQGCFGEISSPPMARCGTASTAASQRLPKWFGPPCESRLVEVNNATGIQMSAHQELNSITLSISYHIIHII